MIAKILLHRLVIFTVMSGVCFYSIAARAQDMPQFGFPVDCVLGQDCWIVNYVDVDPSPDSHQDFTCHSKTYEGHKGTDFAVRSRIEMEQGVDVLATKDGKVLRLRDGSDDLPKTEAQYQAIRDKNRDCGNGVILDHGSGLLSYYCHLKQDSIRVKPGDAVKKGDVIAQIGQSGFSEFPHLHLTIIWEGGHIDPFTGHLKEDGCGKFKDNLWEGDLAYNPYTVFDGGFTGAVPDFTAIEKGQDPVTTLNAAEINALVYWAGFYHKQAGDKITLTIRDPSGAIFAQRETVFEDRRKRPSFYYTGKRMEDKDIPTGRYVGSIAYEKPGFPAQTFSHTVDIR